VIKDDIVEKKRSVDKFNEEIMELRHCVYIIVMVLQVVPLIERPKSAISSMDLTRNSAADMCEQRYNLYYTRSKSTWSKFLFLTDDRTNFFLVIS